MGKRQAKRTVSSGDKVWIVYYRFFQANSFDYEEHGQQIQVFTRREYAMRFLKKLGIEPKAKEIKLDGWWPSKYYGYDKHEECEYTLQEMYGEAAPPNLRDDIVYEEWTERAAAIIIEASLDPLYVDQNPCPVVDNAYMVSAINELDYWGDTDDDGVHTICPQCNYSHNHKDNFCPQCGYSITVKRSGEH